MPAILAALAFGATAPVIAVAGRTAGPLVTAALLYFGAALSSGAQRAVARSSGTGVPRGHFSRILLVSVFGAAIAPVLLAWGLQRTGGTTGSLLLNLEAIFTVALARLIFREPMGRRVGFAILFMVAAGVLLALDASGGATWSPAGLTAVGLATLAWSLDNTLTRKLSEDDPVSVVGLKGLLGAGLTSIAALLMGGAWPDPWRAAALLACGATGYGLSLRLYLVAQRHIGVARTGSIFAVGPFVGAALGWLLGFRSAGPLTALAAVLFAVAVYLHLTERHRHGHRHEAIDHAHPHRHDDGHHEHAHAPPVAGEHTHAHRHDPIEHEHEHAPDLHHSHEHDRAH